MDGWQWVIAAGLLGLALILRRWLAAGRYRTAEESGHGTDEPPTPPPGSPPSAWWLPPTVVVVGIGLLVTLQAQPLAIQIAWWALAVAGPVLAAIDLDVHRLPNRITLPLIPVSAGLTVLAALTARLGDGPSRADDLWRAALATLIVGGGTLLIAFLFFGRSIGMGDAKLMVSLSMLLGWFSWSAVLTGIYLGLALGGLVAVVLLVTKRMGRGGHLAFGPYLVAGALAAAMLHGG